MWLVAGIPVLPKGHRAPRCGCALAICEVNQVAHGQSIVSMILQATWTNDAIFNEFWW